MSDGSFDITLSDITSYDWEACLAGAEYPISAQYDTQLFKKATELGESGEEKGQRVFRFLGSVASLALKEGDDETPFVPSIILENRRSAALEDLDSAELDLLAGLLPTTRDPASRNGARTRTHTLTLISPAESRGPLLPSFPVRGGFTLHASRFPSLTSSLSPWRSECNGDSV